MATRVTALSELRDGQSVGFNLGVIALVAALLGLGFAYLIDGAERARQVPGPADIVVSRTLGNTTLTLSLIHI